MSESNRTLPQRIATGLAGCLWVFGSAFLVQTELSRVEAPWLSHLDQLDWVAVTSTPIIWAAVIALPILAHHALQERRLLAAVLMTLSGVVGSAYTLNGTIGRQAEAKDVKASEAELSAEARQLLLQEFERAKMRREDAKKQADKACSKNALSDNCTGQRDREKAYENRMDALLAELTTAPPAKPKSSGERLVVSALTLITQRPVNQIEPWVQTFGPALLGLFLELAALSLGFYGVSPGRPTSQPRAPLPLPPKPVAPRPVKVQPIKVLEVTADDKLNQRLWPAVSANPRRPGTHGHSSMGIILSNPGLTVAEFVAAGGRLKDLRWDLEKSHVTFAKPNGGLPKVNRTHPTLPTLQ